MNLADVPVVTESRRGCGFRKGGGLYLRTDPLVLAPCDRLPLALHTCPTCGAGVKQTRGWTWIDVEKLFAAQPCPQEGEKWVTRQRNIHCDSCLLCLDEIKRAGLLWIGESFYPTPEAWAREAETMGVSRKIKAVPKGYQPGETWIMVAHPKAVLTMRETENGGRAEEARLPGIFQAFRAPRIEYVCRGDETEEELDALIERGIDPVQVQRANTGETEHQPNPDSQDLWSRDEEDFRRQHAADGPSSDLRRAGPSP